MKRLSALLLSITLMLSLAACGTADTGSSESVSENEISQAEEPPTDLTASPEETEPEPVEEHETVLIAYYSHSNNTAEVAGQIHDLIGGDLYRITPADPYPTDYEKHVAQVAEEIERGYLPPLGESLENIDAYEVIYIGYPMWYRDLALPVKTFLSEYDLSGKTIIPFCTHEGTGAEESSESLATLLPDSTILELFDYDTYNRGAAGAQSEVEAWLDRLGLVDAADALESMSIVITAGETIITAELDGSELAQEFVSILPQTISMSRIRTREFYGSLQGSLSTEGEIQYSFVNGDVAYWFSGNSLALYYSDDDTDGAVNTGIMVFGRITSDLSAFAALDDRVEMIVQAA